jgi:hypothetical protein
MKNLAWGVVIVFNLFFLYYMMTMALTRARDFQVSFSIACLIQLSFEIFIFETLEVAWVQYLIPHLVVKDVRKRIHYLRQQINDAFDVKLSEIENPFDATEYLFVSARLAKEFPSLFESEVILIFSNYLPGAIGERWRASKSWRPSGWKGPSFTILLPVLAVLQWMGTFSMRAQKAIMHVFQPIFCSVGIILAFFLATNPIWLLVPAAFIAFEVYQWSKRRRKAKVALAGDDDVDLNAKMEQPLKVKPEPEGVKITDADDRPVKAKPVTQHVHSAPAVVAIEEPVSTPPVEKTEPAGEEEEEEEEEEEVRIETEEPEECLSPAKEERAQTAPSPPDTTVPPVAQPLDDDDDDDDDDCRTVFDDDGTPSGVERIDASRGGRHLPSNTAARRRTRQDRLRAQELFDQFEKREREEEESGCKEEATSNPFCSPGKALDPFHVSPMQQSLGSSSTSSAAAAAAESVPSPYAGRNIAPAGMRDVRAGRVHLPPVVRRGGPGTCFTPTEGGGAGIGEARQEERSVCQPEDEGNEKYTPKLNWEK